MITVILGTRAQMIKMAPVMLEMERRKLPFTFLLSGQHRHTLSDLIDDFGITTVPDYLYRGEEIDSIYKVPAWFFLCLYRYVRYAKRKHRSLETDGSDSVLVHGDTFSTILGAIAARFTGARVYHVEAGLRSFRLLHPFPEELNRLITFRLSDVSFCPGEGACRNMAGYGSAVINTSQNTLLDAARIGVTRHRTFAAEETGYCVCSIHRFENVFIKSRLEKIISLVEMVAQRIRVKFVLHPPTRKRLIKYGLYKDLSAHSGIELLDRMNYTTFVGLLHGASFAVTDGGSNQEELYYLGKPTLIMRKHTERPEGLSSTAVLSGLDEAIVRRFLDEVDSHRRENKLIESAVSPSSQIVDFLENPTAYSLSR